MKSMSQHFWKMARFLIPLIVISFKADIFSMVRIALSRNCLCTAAVYTTPVTLTSEIHAGLSSRAAAATHTDAFSEFRELRYEIQAYMLFAGASC